MEISEKLNRILSLKKKKIDASAGEDTRTKSLANSCKRFFTEKIEFHTSSKSDSHLDYLKLKYRPLNKPMAGSGTTSGETVATVKDENAAEVTTSEDDIPSPKKELFDSRHLEIEWKQPRAIGAGLQNMGNTCFLNSVLQCLVYTPPLYNFITTAKHKLGCQTQGFCVMCELQKHTGKVFTSTNGMVKPSPIVQNLRVISKQFRQGRQEDAHEFLRYFVDGLQKICLQGQPSKLDLHSKTTTVVHKIFGGYHRSQVKCLECLKTSDTFDPLLDVSLDIKNCNSLTRALQKSTQVDTLENDNSYACPSCKKMTRAQKKFTIHRLPNVLTIQLKRFEYNGMFGGKINKSITYPEHVNMRPYMSDTSGPGEWYRLYAVLVHMGYSSNSGHYFCYVKNSNKTWYCMNDTSVTQVSLTSVLAQEAYLLFYVRDLKYRPDTGKPGNTAVSKKTQMQQYPQQQKARVPPPPPRTSAPLGSKKSRSNGNGKAKAPQGAAAAASASSTSDPSSNLPPVATQPPSKPLLPKPTGIVNPSPHPKLPKTGSIPLPPLTMVTSPPPPKVTTPTTPPTNNLSSPKNVSTIPPVPVAPHMASSVPEADPVPMEATPTPSSKESVALPLIIENKVKVATEPSIPLRKEGGDTLPTSSSGSAGKAQPATIPVPPKQPEPKKTTVTKPIFTPRQLANPSKNKKLPKLKRPSLPILGNKVGMPSSASTVEPSGQNDTVPAVKLEPIGAVKSICAPTPTQALLSPPSKPTHQLTLLDMTYRGTVDNRSGIQQEPTTAAPESTRKEAKAEEDLNESGCKVVTVEKKEGSTVKEASSGTGDSSSLLPSTPVPPKNKYFIATAAVGGSLSSPTSAVGIQPMSAASSSKQQKVAMVSPFPQSSASAGAKPVARVKPNLHLDPSVPKSTEFRRTTSCGFKVSESLTPPSPNPPTTQASKSSPWLVTTKGEQGGKSKEGGGGGGPPVRPSFSDATPRGWKVTEVHKQHLPTSGNEDVFKSSSSKSSKKKKKKHRHHSRVSSPSDFSDSDSDWKPAGSSSSKHHKHAHEDREASRRRADTREHARKRSRRDMSDDEAGEDYYNYDRSYDYDEHRRHAKKHKKAHKKHKLERDRERDRRWEKERRKNRHHSTTSYIYSSYSSDSEDVQKKRHHKENRDRDAHRYGGDKRHDLYHSSTRDHHYHHHHHYHHPPPPSSRHRDHAHRSSSPSSDGGEKKKRKERWHERSDRSRSPIAADAKRTAFGSSALRESKDAAKKIRKDWEEAHQSKEIEVKGMDTVQHLQSHSWDRLGDNVLSWSGGGNSIDSSSVVEDKLRKPVRDVWDQELDQGKVKKVKKHLGDEFSSGKNLFQEYQTKKNMNNLL